MMVELREQALNYYLDQSWDICPDFIISGRVTGKTTSLIKLTNNDIHGIIVCPSERMAKYIYHMAINMGCTINYPITYDKLFQYQIGRRNLTYYFDDYGMRLADILRREINRFARGHIRTVMIDEDSINRINDILNGLKVQDMAGNKLKIEMRICKEED